MDAVDSNKPSMDGVWLGRLRVENHFFAEFEPIAELSEGRWVEVENRLSKFPKQGYVWAERGDLGQVKPKGSIWIFGCRPSGKAVHQCVAVGPRRAIPIVDLSSKSQSEAKRQLLEIGVSLPEHQGSQAVVLLPEDTCCSLRFEPHGQASVARLPSNGIVEIHKADPNWKEGHRIGGHLFLPARALPEGEPIEHLDWSTNADFLLKLLDRYRDAVSGYWGLAKKTAEPPIRRLEKALVESRLTASDSAELAAVVDRMRANWRQVSQGLAAIKDMGEFLLESESGKQLLQEAIKAKTEVVAAEIERSVRADIESRLAVTRSTLAELEQAVTGRTVELDAIRQDIESSSQQRTDVEAALRDAESAMGSLSASYSELDQVVSELKATKNVLQVKLAEDQAEHARLVERIDRLKSTIAEFGDKARCVLLDSDINDGIRSLATRLENLLGDGGNPPPPFLPAVAPPWWCPSMSGDSAQLSVDDLERRLGEEASDAGLQPEDMQLMDVFARSGELVLLVGTQASAAVAAYARTVAGGVVRTHALDPSAIGLDDLWRVPATGRPTAFAHAWHEAQARTDKTILVCLSDLDASPFDFWIASLSSVIHSEQRPRNLLILATATQPSRSEQTIDNDALRRYLVAIEPRTGAKAHLAISVHGAHSTPATLLVADWEPTIVSPTVLTRIARAGRDSETVRRALKISRVTNKSHGQLAEAWCDYLTDDSLLDGLPAPLKAGYEALRTIHIQR